MNPVEVTKADREAAAAIWWHLRDLRGAGFVETAKLDAHDVVQAFAKHRQSTAPDRWMPIDSAPRDGTEIDIWMSVGARIADCRWGKPSHANWGDRHGADKDLPPSWVTRSGAALDRRNGTATHWQPKPPAPGTSSSEREMVARTDDVVIGEFIAQYEEAAEGVVMDYDTAELLARELKRLRGLVYVPGVWRCAKCQFSLVQSNLNATDGTVTARDDRGGKCPNDGSPLWRVSYRDWAFENEAGWEALLARKDEQIAALTASEAESNPAANDGEARHG